MCSTSNVSDPVVKQGVEVIRSAGGLVWITGTGIVAKNSEVQRAVRSQVMVRHYQCKKQRKALYDLTVGHPQTATKSMEYQVPAPSRSSLSTRAVQSKLSCPTCLGFLGTAKEGLYAESCCCRRLLHKDSISDSCAIQRDPFFQYPIEVTPQDIKLIDYVLDDNNTNKVVHRHETLSNALSDPIAFHQMLSTFASWLCFKLKYRGGERYLNQDAIRHQNKAMKAVSQRLCSGIGVTSEGMIAAILGFAHHAHVRLDFSVWNSHMNGVKQIVKLRGGIQTLNPELKNTLYWHDLGGACTQVIPLLFDWSTDPISNSFLFRPPTTGPSSSIEQMTKVWLNRMPIQQEFLGLLESLYLIATHFTEEFLLAGCSADGMFPLRCIIKPMLYRILNFRTVTAIKDKASASSYTIVESCRLAALLFLAPLRRHFGVFPVVTAIQVAKLRKLLTKDGDVDWQGLEILQFWVITLGYLESSDDKLWWRGARDILGSRFSLETQLRDFIWIHALHGFQLSILTSNG